MSQRSDELDGLYREVGPAVWAYLRRRVADPNVAEELLQETFVVVVRDFAAMKAAASPRAWLLGIAHNLLRSHRRASAVRRMLPLPPEQAAEDTEPEDPRIDAVRRALAKLPEAQQEALELRLDQDMSYAEIAEALGIPVGTVRSRIHLAVAALREWAAEAGPQRILDA